MIRRIYTNETVKFVGQKVKLAGWVDVRRDHGKIIFIDLRDKNGIIQVVFIPKDKELYESANSLRPEWVIEISGTVNQRPKGMENSDIETGSVELLAEEIVILNEAKTPPFEISDEAQIGEDVRLKYRYLDLRRRRMAKNLKIRYMITKFIRDFMDENEFLEIETPLLTKGTPEGSREFIVPSRLHRGQFYVLPQSPQQFKQLLMVSGVEKYFQIARCFRDEDQRGDRQPEFTQFDVEASFSDEDSIMELIENLLIKLIEIKFPNKKILQKPFPRLSFEQAQKEYQSDKPDLRSDKNNLNELAFCWIVDIPIFEYSQTEKRLVAAHHPFTAPKEEDMELLWGQPEKVRSRAYDIVLNGYEIGGGSVRMHKREMQEKIFKILGLTKEDIEKRFGHLLEAFEYGAPPHLGIALGLDRLTMLLLGEPNIREVIAFPKTGDGRDLMVDAPNEISGEQLKELGIEVKKRIS